MINGNRVAVAITCIGSGIGQSVINSLRLSSMQFNTIGLGNADFEYGALDCDRRDTVPPIHDPGYIDVLLEKCQNYDVDIIIPGLDGDVLKLAKNEQRFTDQGVHVLTAHQDLVSICRDKERLTNHFSKFSDHVIPSYNKETIFAAYNSGEVRFPCIAKLRDGSGSVGVKLVQGEDDIRGLPGEYIFQELLYPEQEDKYYHAFVAAVDEGKVPQLSELSIQYVTGKDGKYLGKLATINKLKHGVPVEIFPIYREEIWEAVDTILPRLHELGLRGPVNIQGRITDGGIKFFEINPRFTGITGLRAMLGFNEVEACVKDWLEEKATEFPFSGKTKKFGLRQVTAKGIAIESHREARRYQKQLSGGREDARKTLLITGSTGYLGRNFINAVDRDQYRIWVLSTQPQKAKQLFDDRVKHIFSRDVFIGGGLPWGGVDILLHAGFARPYRSNQEIADSLAFTEMLFRYAGRHEVPAIINISSQSIYGQAAKPPWKETTPACPESPYAAAKYASEMMLRTEAEHHPHLHVTSLRLAGLTGGQPGLVPVDLVTRFVQQALQGEPLELLGHHRFERLDVRDAVQGLSELLSVSSGLWDEVYNLGKGETFTIGELAEEVIKQVSLMKGETSSRILRNEIHDPLRFGMDSSAFYQLTNWEPEYTLRDSIRSLITYLDR